MMDRAVYTLETLPELIGSPPLYGVIGFPVAHSRSPTMQMAAFRELQLPAKYVRVEIPPERLRESISVMKDVGFLGWNCTIPHKLAMLELLHDKDSSAIRATAVNTVKCQNGRLLGYSTDGDGWVQAIRNCFRQSIQDLRVLLLGAGGSGQTLAREAAYVGCRRLVIANRSQDKAQMLVQSIHQDYPDQSDVLAIPWEDAALSRELRQTDLLVNTTSVGLRPTDTSVISPNILHAGLMVYDLVYQKTDTPLILAARLAGAQAADGLSMLLYQGAEAFKIWTGKEAPVEAMRAALLTVC